MKTQIIVGFIAFGLICALPTFGQQKDVQGWREAKWGMTENEILKAFKGEAVHLDKIGPWDELNLFASIGINNFDIDGDKYDVNFCMDKTAKILKQIYISTSNVGGGVGLLGARHRKLAQLLTEKYGTPSFKDIRGKFYKTSVIAWNFPSTIIELTYMDMEDIKSDSLRIIYSVPKGKDKI